MDQIYDRVIQNTTKSVQQQRKQERDLRNRLNSRVRYDFNASAEAAARRRKEQLERERARKAAEEAAARAAREKRDHHHDHHRIVEDFEVRMQKEIMEKWISDKRMRRRKKMGAEADTGSEQADDVDVEEHVEDKATAADNKLKEIDEDEREESDDSDVATQPKFH